ncbi:AraC family transcriptional regulator [uncultured Imperialibacter sp.]|uniref:helix-turn-helix domain-containing protein n=1 Tax=uncultured Imperialibacter sp. TaxID=1672639 RepID=UPI0030DB25EE
MMISANIVKHLMKKVEVAGYGHLLQNSPDYILLESLPTDDMIPAEMFFRIIDHVATHYPDGQMAYDIEYKHFSLGQINMLGALGQLVQVSPTLQNVSEAFYKYYGKLNSIFSPSIERRGEYIASTITTTEPGLWKQRPFQVAIEMFLYGMMRIVKEWFDAEIAEPVSLTLPYELPGPERTVIRRTVGVDPLMGDGCTLVFKADVFLRPLPFANPQLWEHLKQYLEQNARQGREQELFSSQLEAYIKKSIKNTPDLKVAADHFSLSERSLQRKLRSEQTNFQQVIDRVRKALACQLLRNDQLSLKEIAFECGFSDPNSFFKAFKKWTGVTPEQWKASL